MLGLHQRHQTHFIYVTTSGARRPTVPRSAATPVLLSAPGSLWWSHTSSMGRAGVFCRCRHGTSFVRSYPGVVNSRSFSVFFERYNTTTNMNVLGAQGTCPPAECSRQRSHLKRTPVVTADLYQRV
jgi:hypothetical protein